MTPKITNNGYAQQILALDGGGINFTKIVIGNGSVPTQYRTLSDLMNPLMEIEIDDLEIVENENEETGATTNYAELTASFSNADVLDDFDWTEVGIFCSDPDSTEENPLDDILYAYGHYLLDDREGEGSAHIPACGTEVLEIQLKYRIYIGELENITAVISDSQNYVTKRELNDHVIESNPHNTTAEDVGLGEVENVAFSDHVVAFPEDDSDIDPETDINSINISEGDNMLQFFRKVAYGISNLVTHLLDTVSHITEEERTSWNNKSDKGHQHSTTDITSGVLGVARGGTGGETAAKARVSLGVDKIFVRKQYTTAKLNFSANQYLTGSISLVTVSGYTPAAIADWAMIDDGTSGSSDKNIEINNLSLTSSKINYHLLNRLNSSNHAKMTVSVLYLKNL